MTPSISVSIATSGGTINPMKGGDGMPKKSLILTAIVVLALAAGPLVAAPWTMHNHGSYVMAQAGGGGGAGGGAGGAGGTAGGGGVGGTTGTTGGTATTGRGGTTTGAGMTTGAGAGRGPAAGTYGAGTTGTTRRATGAYGMRRGTRAGYGAGGAQCLPRTGVDVGWLSAVGAAMALGGMALRRRRR